VLRKNGFSAEQIMAIVADFRNAGLEPVEVALMAFAQKVIVDATAVKAGDIEELREFGLSDGEVVDVVLVATSRAFFSKTVDALGAVPEATILADDPALRAALMVPRHAL
jgi:alkylhydroperoxidase family enzyme